MVVSAARAEGRPPPEPNLTGRQGVVVTSVAAVKSARADDPVQALAQRLAEPGVAEALNTLLDHADLLALLVVGLDGLISRGDTIADSLASGVSDLRSAGEQTRLDAVKVVTAAQQLSQLAPFLLDRLSVLENLLNSDLGDPRAIGVASAASRALVSASEQSARPRIGGLRGLLRALKDDDVNRALGFVISVARAFGRELDGRSSTWSRPAASRNGLSAADGKDR